MKVGTCSSSGRPCGDLGRGGLGDSSVHSSDDDNELSLDDGRKVSMEGGSSDSGTGSEAADVTTSGKSETSKANQTKSFQAGTESVTPSKEMATGADGTVDSLVDKHQERLSNGSGKEDEEIKERRDVLDGKHRDAAVNAHTGHMKFRAPHLSSGEPQCVDEISGGASAASVGEDSGRMMKKKKKKRNKSTAMPVDGVPELLAAALPPIIDNPYSVHDHNAMRGRGAYVSGFAGNQILGGKCDLTEEKEDNGVDTTDAIIEGQHVDVDNPRDVSTHGESAPKKLRRPFAPLPTLSAVGATAALPHSPHPRRVTK